MPIPTIPLLIDDIKDAFVCVLKSTFFVRFVRCIMAKPLMTTMTDMAFTSCTSCGSLKNRLIGLARRNIAAHRSMLIMILKIKAVL